jgi:hypothetical protein
MTTLTAPVFNFRECPFKKKSLLLVPKSLWLHIVSIKIKSYPRKSGVLRLLFGF